MIKNTKGFTLVEVMVVTAMVSLLASLAVPSLLRSKVTANEVAAARNLRTISVAMEDYHFSSIPHAYPSSLSDLTAGAVARLDEALAAGAKNGYSFQITSASSDTFQITATPLVDGVTGSRSFSIDESGTLKDLSPISSAVTGSGGATAPVTPGTIF